MPWGSLEISREPRWQLRWSAVDKMRSGGGIIAAVSVTRDHADLVRSQVRLAVLYRIYAFARQPFAWSAATNVAIQDTCRQQ